jgi:hypothetical protein
MMWGKKKHLERNLYQYYFVHHKSHTESLVVQTHTSSVRSQQLTISAMA